MSCAYAGFAIEPDEWRYLQYDDVGIVCAALVFFENSGMRLRCGHAAMRRPPAHTLKSQYKLTRLWLVSSAEMFCLAAERTTTCS